MSQRNTIYMQLREEPEEQPLPLPPEELSDVKLVEYCYGLGRAYADGKHDFSSYVRFLRQDVLKTTPTVILSNSEGTDHTNLQPSTL